MNQKSNDIIEPFGKIMRAEFELRGLESNKHAADTQYKLMLIPAVLRVQVSFAKKSMLIYYADPNKTTEEILDAIKPVRTTLKSRDPVDYAELVKKSYHEKL